LASGEGRERVAEKYSAGPSILFLPDLDTFVLQRVLERSRAIGGIPTVQVPEWAKRTVHVAGVRVSDRAIPWTVDSPGRLRSGLRRSP
jgi:hypothetical protein